MMMEINTAETFEQHRSLLFGIAYRMLGSIAESEDMVQEAYLRWQRGPRDDVVSAKAFLTTIMTRLCIDFLRSARHQREEYVGVWLPEPLLTPDVPPPDARAELSDSLTTAFLLLLETLAPAERAVFLLREVFDYDYDQISRMLEKSEANCRQMFGRAQERLTARRPRFKANRAETESLVQKFLAACARGDADGLVDLLSHDAVAYADGGAKVRAARRPVIGAERVARFFIGASRFVSAALELRLTTINHEPGVVTFLGGNLIQTMTFEVTDREIRAIYIVSDCRNTTGSVPPSAFPIQRLLRHASARRSRQAAPCEYERA